ncbi:MAG TPA: alanine--glyoxylate aminotransferase family protein [Candidatus Dormibacteraeota bacterium]|nr:alanine--glyoxylate aminotransferase family protein [Candidatus Dormibacteraeota bacterium]
MIKQLLLAPGPTPVPSRVRLAMAQPMFHHRTPQFSALFGEVRAQLQELFQTEQDVLMLAASGTGAMEASVNNCFAPGDEVIVVNGGKFGERWGKLATTFGLKPIEIRVEWGRAVRPDQIEQALAEHPNVKGVLLQASETSTAAVHPIDRIAAVTRKTNALLVVDGITAVGVYSIPMDKWGIDVLITGSQKALMLPPGLALVALSARAWERVEQTKQPRFYFDLPRERTNQAKNTTAWTPAISLVIGLREALTMMQEEGYANIYARHERLAKATRAAGAALGLRLVAPDNPSPAVTGLYTPEGIDGGKLFSYLRDKMKVVFAGGQDQLKGKIIRIAHLGYIGAFDAVTAVAALEMALKHFGHPVELGRGVGAAQAELMSALPA